jgi:hypothetical protein
MSAFSKDLYERLVSDLISEDSYKSEKAAHLDKLSKITNRADELRNRRREIEAQVSEYHDLSEAISGIKSDSDLTTGLMNLLVDKILVSHDKTFEIYFRFADEIKETEGLLLCASM